ncbi:MAG TPA: MFS transporter [Stellaceae bacterium]|nr:MFS transporter [Stellaceae bacterium]
MGILARARGGERPLTTQLPIRPAAPARASRATAIFSGFFFLSGFTQTILVTVLPVVTLSVMHDAQAVSLVYVAVGLAGFLGRLGIPALTRVLGRVGVLMLGVGALSLSLLLLWTETRGGVVIGLIFNVFAIACFEVVLTLHVLDYIPRPALGRFEAVRIFYSALPWTLGPWLGVYLRENVAHWLPYLISVSMASLLLAAFWSLGFSGDPATRTPPRRHSLSPALYLVRFFSQPRLRLGWALAVGRSSWWGMFQVYAPIYAIQSGLGAETGGAIVSIGIGWIWLVPLWGWLGRLYGLRQLLIVGYGSAALITIAAAALMGAPVVGAVMLLIAAFCTEIIDGAGNSLYLRAVHPYERSEMTAVFVSYRDFSQFAPPAVFSVVLSVFQLPAVFVTGGIMMLGMTALCRYIPKRF